MKRLNDVKMRTVTSLVLAFSLLMSNSVWAQSDGSEPPAKSVLPILSLDDCVRLALNDSPTLMISEERKHIAAKEVDRAYGAFLPDLTLGTNYQKSERTDYDVEQSSPSVFALPVFDINNPGTQIGSAAFPSSVPNGTFADQSISTSYRDINGRANLNVFSGFSKFSSLSSAKNDEKAAAATVGYTREVVAENVIAAYFNLLRYQRLAEVALETKDQAAKELERTETYFRLGSVAKSDVLQQRVRLENTKLDLVIADNTVHQAFTNLAFNMNRPLASGFDADASILNTDFSVEDVSTLYAEALASRKDLLSSEHAADARNNDVTSASANLLPRVDLFASFNQYNNQSPFILGAQKSGSTTYGYSVSWNIFDRMQTISGRSQAKANARIAAYQLEQAKMNVQVEIRQLNNLLVEARERASVSNETIVQSEEELRLAQERFRVGAGTTLDVIVAQTNLANSRAQEVQAICDFLIAESQMQRAVGRLDKW
ncbi:MAG: outer membrane protein [Candidatus Krumholzibacteriia bacterium]|jgi:outer membrane protein